MRERTVAGITGDFPGGQTVRESWNAARARDCVLYDGEDDRISAEFAMLWIACARFCQCDWWNFSHRDYVIEKLEASKRKPLLALFTDSDTADADVLIARFRNFTCADPWVSNFTATHINCTETAFCAPLPALPIPSVQVLRGPFSKYWAKTTELDPAAWLELLKRAVPPPPIEINSATELRASIANSVNGGTSFHLSTSNRTRTALRMYREAAEYFSVFGCSFTYSLGAVGASVLGGFRSEHFIVKKQIRPIHIEKFISLNRFSLTHAFDYDEFLIAIKERPLVLLLKNATDAYANVSLEKYPDVNFGTMDIENAPQLRRFFDGDIPTVIGYNARRDCLLQNASVAADFLDRVATARGCMAAAVLGHRVRTEGDRPGRSWGLPVVALFALGGIAYAGFWKRRPIEKVKIE
jgi:hypothetical protein